MTRTHAIRGRYVLAVPSSQLPAPVRRKARMTDGQTPAIRAVTMLVAQHRREADTGAQVLPTRRGDQMEGAGFRSWLPRWQITLTVVTVVVAGGAAAVAHWP